MITKDQMMEELLLVVPSFRPEWEEFLEYWKETDDPPLYLPIGNLAHHLVNMLERKETETFPAVFEVVERLLIEGEHFVQETTIIGFLEKIQRWNFHKTTKPRQFEPFFGSKTLYFWEELYKYWERIYETKKDGSMNLNSRELPQKDNL